MSFTAVTCDEASISMLSPMAEACCFIATLRATARRIGPIAAAEARSAPAGRTFATSSTAMTG